MFHRASSYALLALVVIATPMSAQITVPRGSLRAQSNAPRLLVANPYTPSQADSAAAVAIGNGLRERMNRSVVGRDFTVITREQMNTALAEWGYPADAILNATTSNTFAVKAAARTVVQSTLTKLPAGHYSMTTRLVGTGEPAGYTVTIAQEPGQKLEDFGARAADALRPGVRALGDARACVEQAATNPAKAAEAAEKALKVVPNHGLAEFCLGALAAKRDSVSPEAMQRYRNATIGDPLAINAYAELGRIQQMIADSAGVVQTYQTMLRIEPGNQLLRDQAFGLFIRWGRPDAAQEVADEGIRLDPNNTDWYDLKSGVCIFREDYACAINELERAFEIDSTRADTAFYKKIVFAAKQRPDTAAYLKWSRKGADKYPSDIDLLEEVSRAFALTGETDSTIAVTRRLVMLDETKTDAVLRVTQQLVNAGAAEKATEFAATIRQFGSDQDKADFAGLMLQAAQPMIQGEGQNLPMVVTLAEAALASGTTAAARTEASNYFLGLAAFFQVATLSQEVRAQKSCELARKEQALIAKAEPALMAASKATNAQIASQSAQWLATVQQEKPAVEQLVAQFCR